MSKPNLTIDGEPATEEKVIDILKNEPRNLSFIRYGDEDSAVTIQPNPIRRGWQLMREFPNGRIEFADKIFTPAEITQWWLISSNSTDWAEQLTWRTDKSGNRGVFWKLILLLLSALLLIGAGIYLILLAIGQA